MTPLQTITEHYQVIINKNVDGICNMYVPSEDTYVILEGPRLTTIGFTKIKKGWIDFCASSLQLISINWIEGPFVDEVENMAYVAGIISLKVSVNGTEFENIFRTTFILQKQQTWKIKHEHVSLAHPDPYGIGDWLKKA